MTWFTKSVLSSIVIYHSTIFELPKWVIRRIDKIKQNFIWKGEDSENVSGGYCQVNWQTVYRRARA